MARDTIGAIRRSGLTIYDTLENRPELLLSTRDLERILQKRLAGIDLNLPLRTRSKKLKAAVCDALGYSIPSSFRRTKPRFPGQCFDTYVQKSDNLQIWNEEVEASRRYVIVVLDAAQTVRRIRVLTGEEIAKLDNTGTLTHKYQARSRTAATKSSLVSPTDTSAVIKLAAVKAAAIHPRFLPIAQLHRRLLALIGTTLEDAGRNQERLRGAALHRVISRILGQTSYADSGQFPDIPEQLLEVKLQTAPTIDLGLVCPDSNEPLAGFPRLRHSDVRYSVVYGSPIKDGIRIDHIITTTGKDFFAYFRRFEGNVKNAKLQIRLPSAFFR